MFEEQASEENDDEEWAGNYLDTPQHRKKNASRLKAARRITSGDDEKNLQGGKGLRVEATNHNGNDEDENSNRIERKLNRISSRSQSEMKFDVNRSDIAPDSDDKSSFKHEHNSIRNIKSIEVKSVHANSLPDRFFSSVDSAERPKNREQLDTLIAERSKSGAYNPSDNSDDDDDDNDDDDDYDIDKRVDVRNFHFKVNTSLDGDNHQLFTNSIKTVGNSSSKPPLVPMKPEGFTLGGSRDYRPMRNKDPSRSSSCTMEVVANDSQSFASIHEFNLCLRLLPLSKYAHSSGFIIDGVLEKISRNGIWVKRYFVLTESSSKDICVLQQYGKAVESAWGNMPIDLKTITPIDAIEKITVSSRKREFSVMLKSTIDKKEVTDIDEEEVGSMCSDRSGLCKVVPKNFKFRAPDGELRLAWVTLLQKARSFVNELRRE